MADIKAIKGTDGTTYNLRDDYSVWGGANLLCNIPYEKEPSQYKILDVNLIPKRVLPNETYTLQCWFENSGRTAIRATLGVEDYSVFIDDWVSIDNTTTYFTVTFQVPDDFTYVGWIALYASTTGGDQGATSISGTLTPIKWKLEKGHKATDWSPCYYDMFMYDPDNNQLVVNL